MIRLYAVQFVVHVFASFAALAVIARQGTWLLPPRRAPFMFGVALGLVAWLGWRRGGRMEAP